MRSSTVRVTNWSFGRTLLSVPSLEPAGVGPLDRPQARVVDRVGRGVLVADDDAAVRLVAHLPVDLVRADEGEADAGGPGRRRAVVLRHRPVLGVPADDDGFVVQH